MVNLKNLRESGSKSGEIFCGKIRLYTADKQNWITMEIDASGDLLLSNRAGETATVNLS